MHGHYKKICAICDNIFEQCRCLAPDKTIIRGEICQVCKEKEQESGGLYEKDIHMRKSS